MITETEWLEEALEVLAEPCRVNFGVDRRFCESEADLRIGVNCPTCGPRTSCICGAHFEKLAGSTLRCGPCRHGEVIEILWAERLQ